MKIRYVSICDGEGSKRAKKFRRFLWTAPYVNLFYFSVFEAENLGDNQDKNCQKQASEYNDDTLVRSEDFGAQQSQYSTHSTEVRFFFFHFAFIHNGAKSFINFCIKVHIL